MAQQRDNGPGPGVDAARSHSVRGGRHESDVIVVGAGPGGSATAAHLARGSASEW